MGDKSAFTVLNKTITTPIICGVAEYFSDSSSSNDESDKLDIFGKKKIYFNWTLGSVHHSISFICQKKRNEMLHIMHKKKTIN